MDILFLCSIGDDHLETMNINSDFAPDHVHTVENNKVNELSKVVQNGCTFELIEEDSCDTQTIQKSQEIDLSEICPVGPQKASLLYPLEYIIDVTDEKETIVGVLPIQYNLN